MEKSHLFPSLSLLLVAALSLSAMGADEASAPIADDSEPATTTLPDIVYEEPAFNEFNFYESLGFELEMTLWGDLWTYSVWENNVNFSTHNAAFVETVARLGAEFRYGSNVSAQIRMVGTDVHKRPDRWTMPRRDDWHNRLDLANLSIASSIGGMDSTVTVGVQEIGFGDGLLVYDGYSEKRAIYSNAIRSFPGVRWSLGVTEGYTLDLFTAVIHDDHLNYEAWFGDRAVVEGGGQLSGINLNVVASGLGDVDVGLFYKDDNAENDDPLGRDTNSNTWALSFRDAISLADLGFPEPCERVTFTGEVVKQWGRTKVVEHSLVGKRHSRSAFGGQLALKYEFTDENNSPYMRARWSHFQGDSNTTSAVEAFDPFFPAPYYDYGMWNLGDISSYYYPNSNKRVITLEYGMEVLADVICKILYYDISLDQKMDFSGSPQWSNELNLVVDWVPCDHGFVGCLLGAAAPGGAAKKYYGGDNETQTQVAVWAGLTF